MKLTTEEILSTHVMREEYRDIHQNSTIAAEVVTYIVAEVIIAIMCVCNNFIVLIAIYRFQSLHTSTYWCIASLAVADIGVGLIGIPSAILLRIGLVISNSSSAGHDAEDHAAVDSATCFFIVSSVLFLTQVSIFSLLVIAIDRFIAIYFALRYRAIVTSIRVKIGIALTWCFGAIIGFAPQLGWMNDASTYHNSSGTMVKNCYFTQVISMEYMVYFNFFVCVLVPLTIMLILYALIFMSAKQQLKKIYDAVPSSVKNASKYSSTASLSSRITFYSSKLKTSKRSVCYSQNSIDPRPDYDKIKSGNTKKNLTKCVTDPLLHKGNNVSNKNGYMCPSCLKQNRLMPISKSVEDLAKKQESNTIDCRCRSYSLNFERQKKHSCQNNSSNSKCLICEKALMQTNPKRFLGQLPRVESTNSTDSNLYAVIRGISEKKQLLKRKSKLLRKEFKAARILFTVIIVFALCWLPLHIYNTVSLLYPNYKYLAWLTDCTILLTHLNSTLNPLIYSYRINEIKLTYQRILNPLWVGIKHVFCCLKSENLVIQRVS